MPRHLLTKWMRYQVLTSTPHLYFHLLDDKNNNNIVYKQIPELSKDRLQDLKIRCLGAVFIVSSKCNHLL